MPGTGHEAPRKLHALTLCDNLTAFLALLPPKGSLLALDVSKRRIGLAGSDVERRLVTPLATIERAGPAKDLERLRRVAREREAVGLVVGLPLNMDGSEGSMAEAARREATAFARALGLPIKLHAEQLSDMGGARLAASYGALSCDHIEHLGAEGIAAMRASGTVAVLLPGAFYFLRDTHLPPIEALRAADVPMAVSTDHNPGTSPALSLLLMVNMACTLFRLTVPEAIAGVTQHAARALGLQDTHGRIAVGLPANFVLWTLSEAAELAYWFGQRPIHAVVRQGRVYFPSPSGRGQDEGSQP